MNIKQSILAGLCCALFTMTSACSENKENEKEHVWKNQTDALQSAKATAKKLENNLQQQQQTLQQED